MTRILVLSTGNTVLEDAIEAAGDRVHLLVPAHTAGDRRVIAKPGTKVLATETWGDRHNLDAILPRIPAVDGVATMDEQCIEDAHYLAARLRVPALPGLTHDAANFRDKARMKTTMGSAEIRTAPHAVVERAEEILDVATYLGWPLLAKPRAGAATTGMLPIHSPKDLTRIISAGAFDQAPADTVGRLRGGPFLHSLHSAPNGFLVEPLLPVDHEWVVDVWRQDNRPLASAVMHYDRPLLDVAGQHSYTTLLPDDHPATATTPSAAELIAFAEKAATALGLHTGVAHTELLQVGKHLYFGESGARLPGGGMWELYARQHGWNIPGAMADLIAGRAVTLPPNPGYRYLSTLHLAAPPGYVRDVASPLDLMEVPGVIDANHRLRPGEPSPPMFGTLSLAGTIVFASDTFDDVAKDATRIIDALRLDVLPQQDLAGSGAAR